MKLFSSLEPCKQLANGDYNPIPNTLGVLQSKHTLFTMALLDQKDVIVTQISLFLTV